MAEFRKYNNKYNNNKFEKPFASYKGNANQHRTDNSFISFPRDKNQTNDLNNKRLSSQKNIKSSYSTTDKPFNTHVNLAVPSFNKNNRSNFSPFDKTKKFKSNFKFNQKNVRKSGYDVKNKDKEKEKDKDSKKSGDRSNSNVFGDERSKKQKPNRKNDKPHKKLNTFVYRIDYADPQRKRAKTSLSRELFLVKTKLLRFYNNIKKDQIRRYANTKTFKLKFKAARGYTNKALLKYSSKNTLKKRLALNAFFSLVEHRLDVLLFRSNFVSTMLQARQWINHRHILVNEKTITHAGYMLKNFDIISISASMERFSRLKIISNLNKKRITLYPPKYVYVDYRLMRSALISNPLVSQVPFPFKIDLRKWLGLAKYMF
eukprot:TRINITY_DN182_c0_g1_i4.p3 TRINITY_DN182_c0_g1~~TRINITY_DN182_c0_g1_i4.p3  ORF type:complete len:373 (-),score=-13.90 TRINITY_DN182_c0_g1_i4:7299-8417(-)